MRKYLKVIIKCLPILVWAYISWIFRYSRHPEKYDLRLRFSKVQSLIRKVLKAFNVIMLNCSLFTLKFIFSKRGSVIRKAFLTNSIGTLCSRVFGLVRDLCMASFLGAGIVSDIFFVAFKFPNLCRRIFAEGAFVQSFLPNFVQARKKGAFSVLVFVIFFSIILLLSLFVWQFSGLVTRALANGFSEENIELAKPIVAINFWYLELIFVATFLSSLLQYKNCFWVSAYNTALLNVCMIIALFFVRDIDDMRAVYILSYGVLCGGLAQIALHFYPLLRLGYGRLFSVGITEVWRAISQKGGTKTRRFRQILQDIRSFFARFLPAMLGSSTAQIASFLDTVIASYLSAGAISYLYYANRIFQLPLALFAIAISTALFPTIMGFMVPLARRMNLPPEDLAKK